MRRRPPPPGRLLLPAAGLLCVAASLLSAPAAQAAPRGAAAAKDGSLVMVLDSSGSMAGPDGSGHTRIESARSAVGSVADALARQLVRASELSADAYRMVGEPVMGGATPAAAPALAPGQYTDTLGPGGTRWYAVTLDAVSAADLSATAAPQPRPTTPRWEWSCG
jgi:hypothetical protein